MDDSPATGTWVDDSQAFLQYVQSTYSTFEEFMQDFRAFQIETSSSFFMYNSQTAKQRVKDGGAPLPPGFPYHFVNFCCVHRKRKASQGKRYKNYNCRASVIIRAFGSEYRVVKWFMVHNHDFHLAKPSIYVRNRRLTADQEVHLFDLMKSMKSTRGIIEYAHERFNHRLLPSDVRSIVTRLSKSNRTDETGDSLQDSPQEPTIVSSEPEPPASNPTENHGNTMESSEQAVSVPSQSNSKKALAEEVAADLVRALMKMNDTQFQKQYKMLRFLKEALTYWPSMDLFARMPGTSKLVRLSDFTTVDEVFEKFERNKRGRFESPGTVVTQPRFVRQTVQCIRDQPGLPSFKRKSLLENFQRKEWGQFDTPARIVTQPRSVRQTAPCARDQPTRSSCKRKPLLVLRETFVDDMSSSDDSLQETQYYRFSPMHHICRLHRS